MNEQLQEKLLEIVTKIESGTESAWGFITEQTPDVVEQLLLWHGVYSFVFFSLGFIVIVLSLIFSYGFLKIHKEKRNDAKENDRYYDDSYGVGSCVSLAFGSISGFLILLKNLTWLQIWLAPKVWLLEYVQAMVK